MYVFSGQLLVRTVDPRTAQDYDLKRVVKDYKSRLLDVTQSLAELKSAL